MRLVRQGRRLDALRIKRQGWAVAPLLVRIREVKGVAKVEAGSSCLSACVFVLAGAPYRVVQAGAVVGIHRPYDPTESETAAELQKRKQASLDALVRAYLKEVNVPPSLYEAMLKAPEVRPLPPSELSWYGLNAADRNLR